MTLARTTRILLFSLDLIIQSSPSEQAGWALFSAAWGLPGSRSPPAHRPPLHRVALLTAGLCPRPQPTRRTILLNHDQYMQILSRLQRLRAFHDGVGAGKQPPFPWTGAVRRSRRNGRPCSSACARPTEAPPPPLPRPLQAEEARLALPAAQENHGGFRVRRAAAAVVVRRWLSAVRGPHAAAPALSAACRGSLHVPRPLRARGRPRRGGADAPRDDAPDDRAFGAFAP